MCTGGAPRNTPCGALRGVVRGRDCCGRNSRATVSSRNFGCGKQRVETLPAQQHDRLFHPGPGTAVLAASGGRNAPAKSLVRADTAREFSEVHDAMRKEQIKSATRLSAVCCLPDGDYVTSRMGHQCVHKCRSNHVSAERAAHFRAIVLRRADAQRPDRDESDGRGDAPICFLPMRRRERLPQRSAAHNCGSCGRLRRRSLDG